MPADDRFAMEVVDGSDEFWRIEVHGRASRASERVLVMLRLGAVAA